MGASSERERVAYGRPRRSDSARVAPLGASGRWNAPLARLIQWLYEHEKGTP
jgi:hypothetical protein